MYYLLSIDFSNYPLHVSSRLTSHTSSEGITPYVQELEYVMHLC